jgi:hypothetical protein
MNELSKMTCPVMLLCLIGLAGCGDKSGGASPSASATGRPATCDGVGAEYGEGFGDVFVKKGQPASVKADVVKAVVTSCKEDHWDESTLGCLQAASRMKARNGTDTLDACISGMPDDVQKKMESRVKAVLK